MDLRIQTIPPSSLGSSMKDLLDPINRGACARTRFSLASSSSCFCQESVRTGRGGWRVQDPYEHNLSGSLLCARALRFTADGEIQQNQDLPPVLPKRKKKPFLTPPKVGGFQVKKKGPQEEVLQPPANGLLAQELIPVAHKVLEARITLIDGVTKLMKVIPVKACRFCLEGHIGPVGHQLATCGGVNSGTRRARHVWTDGSIDDVVAYVDTYHLPDRLGTVRHEERFEVERIPAVVELCIQAGVDFPEYPTKRRTRPVRRIGRRILEFDPLTQQDEHDSEGFDKYAAEGKGIKAQEEDDVSSRAGEVNVSSYKPSEAENEVEAWKREIGDDRVTKHEEMTSALTFQSNIDNETSSLRSQELVDLAERTLQAWDTMRNGARKLMAKYPVRVCGYCPEVHVGPRGHKVKLCGAYKHQWRAGQHGWQEASIDDLIPPKYVWHVREPEGPPLVNELKRFYGQTPAVVELCVQAGAVVPDRYKAMMRLDVVIPDFDEFQKVV